METIIYESERRTARSHNTVSVKYQVLKCYDNYCARNPPLYYLLI